MNNLTQLNHHELQSINGGGWLDSIIGPLEDWLLCNLVNGENCPPK